MTEHSSNGKEIIIEGVAASNGLAMGELCVYKRKELIAKPITLSDELVTVHQRRFEYALHTLERELKRLAEGADPELATILDTQIEILHDPELQKQINYLIEEEHTNVDYAIYKAFRGYIQRLEQSGNALMKERIVDIEDVRDKLIHIIRRSSPHTSISSGIVVTDELTPSEIAQFAGHNLEALAMDHGGITSHTSIIARSMGIPAVAGLQQITSQAHDGDEIIIDGFTGKCILNPSSETRTQYQNKIKELERREKHLQKILAKENVTQDGTPFELQANVEFEQELENVAHYHADGIGLLRTESLYISRGLFEDVETQEQFYEHMLTGINGPVTIRLFDVGGDKFFEGDYWEANPFLGWRGIRMLLQSPSLLRDQLKAIADVAGRYPGRVRLMVPMVSVIDEVRKVRHVLREVYDEMREEDEPVDEQMPVGIMVEVPSVALQAEQFAQEVDFFSIGTNDLTQYTMAVDRGNDRISQLFQQHHPAVWKLIDQTAQAGLNAGIPVAVCGELASEPAAAAALLGMGIRSLSMAPSSIGEVKSLLRSRTIDELETFANQVRSATSSQQVEEYFEAFD
ncbi:MAG: phosphoenolpyruvate--protein phosphotransferase [Bacteroidota bacterium]